MRIRYIGNFPPPFGGVTIKNQFLFGELSQRLKIHRLKQSRWFPTAFHQAINCLLALIPGQTLLIGISSKGGKSLLLTRLLYRLNRSTMRRSVYFMMGGLEAGRIAADQKQIEMYRQYKKLYVETESMKKTLTNVGMDNVSVFPNCRKKRLAATASAGKDNSSGVRASSDNGKKEISPVFFSLVSYEKGIDLVAEAAHLLPKITFHVYGEVVDDYSEAFNTFLSLNPNLVYHGVFKGTTYEVYDELSKYDVLLFPTRWKSEGVPGVLVEAKIAGLPAIVSDAAYNAEIVQDGISGIVLTDNTADRLVQTITYLNDNQQVLSGLKSGAVASAESFYVENYIDDILGNLGV